MTIFLHIILLNVLLVLYFLRDEEAAVMRLMAMKTKTLSLMLILFMVAGIFPAQSFADEHTTHDNISDWTPKNALPDTAGSYYLTNDVTLSATWSAPSGTTNLCLNGHKISYSGGTSSSENTIKIGANSTLNIYDCDSEHKGTIENTGYGRAIFFDGTNSNIGIYGGTIKANGKEAISTSKTNSTLIIDGENVEIISTASVGVYFAYGAKLEINKGKLQGGTYGLQTNIFSGKTLTITGGMFIGATYGAQIQGAATINITGGTFSGGTYGIYTTSTNLTITGGTFIGNTEGLFLYNEASQFISGGTFSSMPNLNWIANRNAPFEDNTESKTWTVKPGAIIFYYSNGWDSTLEDVRHTYTQDKVGTNISLSTFTGLGFTAPDGKTFIEWNTSPNGDGTAYSSGANFAVTTIKLYAIYGPTASVTSGDIVTNYNTLALAIKAARDGNTVTLLDNITLIEEVSINKNITLEGNSKTITLSGTNAYLTIPANKTVTVQNLNVSGSNTPYGIKAKESKLTLNNVKIIGEISNYGICVDGAEITIYGEDTEIIAPKGFSILTGAYTNNKPSVLTIYDGKIGSIGDLDGYSYPNSYSVIRMSGGELVNNIETIHMYCANDQVNIMGGIVNGSINFYHDSHRVEETSITISAGKFKSGIDTDGNARTHIITGGKYTRLLKASYIAPDYKVFDNIDEESKDYPYLVARPVKVTFNANNDSISGTMEPQDVPENIEYILNANSFIAPNGKTFTGWNTLANPTETNHGTTYYDKSRITLGNTTNLYAQWKDIAAASPTISSVTALTADNSLTYGYSEGSITVTAAASTDTTYDLAYQWYSSSTGSSTGGTLIDGANSSNYIIPTGKDVGTYYYYCVVTATRQDNGQTATATSNIAAVTVNKANSAPANVAKSDRVYDKTERPLLTISGNVVGGTMYYALSETEPAADSTAWRADIPTAINAGTYRVWYKVKGDNNHNDTDPVLITVKISDAASEIADTSITVLKGQTQTLVMNDSTGTGSRNWTLSNAPEWVTLTKNSDGQAAITANPPVSIAEGTYTCTVQVANTNSEVLSSSAEVKVIVSSGITVEEDGNTQLITEGTYEGIPRYESISIVGDKFVTTTKTEFKSGTSKVLETEIAVAAEATDFAAIVNAEFSTVVTVDVSVDVADPDFKNYAYSLDVTGLPEGLKADGDLTSTDKVVNGVNVFRHVFSITGTPTQSADSQVNIKPVINVSNSKLTLVSTANKDIQIKVRAATLSSISVDISGDTLLETTAGTSKDMPLYVAVTGTYSDGSSSDIKSSAVPVWKVSVEPASDRISFDYEKLLVGAETIAGEYTVTLTATATSGSITGTDTHTVAVKVNPAKVEAVAPELTVAPSTTVSVSED
ncbi:MAG: InlB B-repeat-containing protein [Synergistaceae bacterium]|nr:InlB B-repeat-containing protein [Synergistaceae bacterium]